MLTRHISEISISADGIDIPVTRELEHRIDQIIGPDILAEGTIAGDLETVNVHNRSTFYIYPTVGPKKVLCNFPVHLFEAVKLGLKQYVSVSGKLRYKAREPFPYAIDVTDIEINPPGNELPSLWDLRGIEEHATGDVDSVAFIRAMRDAKK